MTVFLTVFKISYSSPLTHLFLRGCLLDSISLIFNKKKWIQGIPWREKMQHSKFVGLTSEAIKLWEWRCSGGGKKLCRHVRSKQPQRGAARRRKTSLHMSRKTRRRGYDWISWISSLPFSRHVLAQILLWHIAYVLYALWEEFYLLALSAFLSNVGSFLPAQFENRLASAMQINFLDAL